MAAAVLTRAVVVGAAALALAAAAPAAPGTSLTVTYWPHGRQQPSVHWTLSCAPARGTHPHPGLACTALRAHAADLMAATRPCTLMPTRMSPQAALAGTFASRSVTRAYRIGCPGWEDLRLVLTGR